MTYRVADRVISTNGSYKAIAERRGHRDPATVTVVRSGPDTRVMRPVYPDPAIRGDADGLLCYLGIMGPQDGVETVLDLMHELVHNRGRTGLHAVLLGFGDCLEQLKARCTALDLDDNVRFTGRVGPTQYLSAADIGIGPDQKTPLNDVSTMNKTMEYMAYALPSVSVDLVETRVSADDAGVLVPSGDIPAFADAIEALLDDPRRRAELGLAARRRVTEFLDWRPQAQAYGRRPGCRQARRLALWRPCCRGAGRDRGLRRSRRHGGTDPLHSRSRRAASTRNRYSLYNA
jgi:glycosyltransferase involved in cell wall biosynthesis